MSLPTWDDWRARAAELEAADRLEEMENLAPVNEAFTRREREVAEVYAARVARLAAAGAFRPAREAMERGLQYVQAYVRQSDDADRSALWSADWQARAAAAVEACPTAPPPSASSTPGVDPVPDDAPDWWRRAVRLEYEDKLAEAERTILDHVQHIGAASSVAYLYERRAQRFLAVGDRPAANAAAAAAEQWLFTYASWATSGGEGAALSLERDQRVAALRALLAQP